MNRSPETSGPGRTRARPLAIAAIVASLVLLGAGAARAQDRTRAKPLYWGAWIGDQLTGEEAPWDMSAVSSFESMAGKGMSLVNFSSPFANCSSKPCTPYSFPTTPFDNIRRHGAIPFFSWNSASLPVHVDEPDYRLAAVTRGAFDAYIRSWAGAAKRWGHPFFLRFNWEMNGEWFPWGASANGNTARDYVRAWRHVHDVFTSAGASNATWVWCPNVDPGSRMTSLSRLYPGNAYVDWTCLDGYSKNSARTSFHSLFWSTYKRITTRIAPSKPMVIGETAASEVGGAKSRWIADVLTRELPLHFPKVRAFLWFEKFDDGEDWPIETSARARISFAHGIASSRYVGSAFGALASSGPIRPLR